jgi:large subunit ribosomal protein L13
MAQIYNITKSNHPTKTGLKREWYVLDAATMPVGRLATTAAKILMGKNKACYHPAVDMGGCVVIINTDKLVLTGRKADRKVYFRYDNGRVGSLKYRTHQQQMDKDSTVVIYKAIQRMLPKNRHKDLRMNNRVRLFTNENHNLDSVIEAGA